MMEYVKIVFKSEASHNTGNNITAKQFPKESFNSKWHFYVRQNLLLYT